MQRRDLEKYRVFHLKLLHIFLSEGFLISSHAKSHIGVRSNFLIQWIPHSRLIRASGLLETFKNVIIRELKWWDTPWCNPTVLYIGMEKLLQLCYSLAPLRLQAVGAAYRDPNILQARPYEQRPKRAIRPWNVIPNLALPSSNFFLILVVVSRDSLKVDCLKTEKSKENCGGGTEAQFSSSETQRKKREARACATNPQWNILRCSKSTNRRRLLQWNCYYLNIYYFVLSNWISLKLHNCLFMKQKSNGISTVYYSQ